MKLIFAFIFCSAPLLAKPSQNLEKPLQELREAGMIELNLHQILCPHARGEESLLLKLIEEEYLFNKYAPKESSEIREKLEQRLKSKESQVSINRFIKSQKITQSLSPSSAIQLLGEYGYTTMDLNPEVLREWGKLLPDLAKRPEIEAYMDRMMESISAHLDYRHSSIKSQD